MYLLDKVRPCEADAANAIRPPTSDRGRKNKAGATSLSSFHIWRRRQDAGFWWRKTRVRIPPDTYLLNCSEKSRREKNMTDQKQYSNSRNLCNVSGLGAPAVHHYQKKCRKSASGGHVEKGRMTRRQSVGFRLLLRSLLLA